MDASIKKCSAFILDTLFPIECVGCKQEGEWICDACARKVSIVQQVNCAVCKKSSPRGDTCFSCQEDFPIARLVRFFDYDEPVVKEGIRIAKYSYVKEIFRYFSEIALPYLAPVFEGGDLDPRALVFVPVPLHPRRMRERGFNQAELIGERFAQQLGAQLSRALVRTRCTLSQAGMDEADRTVNIKRAFRCTDPIAIDGRYTILVDDVATTGSTLAECARVLKDAGARQVWALALAKG